MIIVRERESSEEKACMHFLPLPAAEQPAVRKVGWLCSGQMCYACNVSNDLLLPVDY